MDAARRLPPARGRLPDVLSLEEELVQCSLRIPPAYRDQIRELAANNGTSAGGAVMILLDAIDAIRELAASNTNAGSSATSVLDALLRHIMPPTGLKSLR